jgi:hypothetical protein
MRVPQCGYHTLPAIKLDISLCHLEQFSLFSTQVEEKFSPLRIALQAYIHFRRANLRLG